MPPGQAAAYAPASAGPFHCGDCEYQKALICVQPDAVREQIMLGNASKDAKSFKVESGGCCAYQEKR
jgi:hypothetical protein